MKLLPCPFCGEKDDIAIRYRYYNGECIDIYEHAYVYIECLPCGVRTSNCFEADAFTEGFNGAKNMAIKTWNRRNK